MKEVCGGVLEHDGVGRPASSAAGGDGRTASWLSPPLISSLVATYSRLSHNLYHGTESLRSTYFYISVIYI